MTGNPYNKASQAYQRHSDSSLTPLQIVVELYKGMLRNVRSAKECYEMGKLDVMSNHIIKTFDVLEALQGNLDLQNGGEDAAFLNRFYNVVFSALSLATAKPDPVKEFDGIIAYIQQVHDRFAALAYPAKPPPPSAETVQS
jgi:flagellar biosynthetic protein FliS